MVHVKRERVLNEKWPTNLEMRSRVTLVTFTLECEVK